MGAKGSEPAAHIEVMGGDLQGEVSDAYETDQKGQQRSKKKPLSSLPLSEPL